LIYILEFFKGASLALVFFGIFLASLKFNSLLYLCLASLPGLALSLIFILLIKNYELKNQA